MSLQDDLIRDFSNKPFFTPKDVLNWYQESKTGGSAYYSNIYMMFLMPLMSKGKIMKISRGVYRVVGLQLKALEAEDEFELYLKAKQEAKNI